MADFRASLNVPHLNRRAFFARTAAATVGLTSWHPPFTRAGAENRISGVANPDLAPFDRLMTSFVAENKVPGASLAVARNGKLMYARGFGNADVEKGEAVQPAALFRIASVSKPITAVAIMQMVEKGKLGLDDRVMDRMGLTPVGALRDQRWQRITIRQCLQHTGGWDRKKSYDPISRPKEIARTLGIRLPVMPVHIVRYMMGQPLDFNPGEYHAYSNLGYLVLGRIIEAVTGMKYEDHVKKAVFTPLGITAPRLGRALLENRTKDEVKYYDAKKRTGPAVYPECEGQQVPLQYGGDNLEAYEAHGGWIASAVDLVKFATAFDVPATCSILGAKAIAEMWSRPDGLAGKDADGTPKAAFYGCGWSVRPIAKTGKVNTWHTGFIAGSEALLVHRWDGLNWAVLFNTATNPDGKSLSGLIDGQIHGAADKVKRWPDADQFASFLK